VCERRITGVHFVAVFIEGRRGNPERVILPVIQGSAIFAKGVPYQTSIPDQRSGTRAP
jgi:hypothetical protein